MKRIVIFVASLACAAGAQAKHTQFEKALERASFERDSIASVLAKHRANYAVQNDSIKEKLTPTILDLERRLESAQATYEKALADILERDAQSVVAAYEKAAQADTVVVQATQTVVEDKKAEGETAPNTYEALFAEMQGEDKVLQLVAQYFEKYDELLNLQRQYMEAATKKEAESIAAQFAAKNDELVVLNGEIASQWHAIYYDRIYAYNVLAERNGHSEIGKFSEAQVRGQIRAESGKYCSDALVDYFISRQALLEYEMKSALALMMTSSFETLQGRKSALANRDYRLSKLSLERRSFICYEDISVKFPSIYNASNPVPKTQVEDYGTVYRIRIGIFAKKMSVSMLRGVKPVSYTYNDEDGEYSYFVGGFRTEAEAEAGAKRLKEIGFKEPIIAVWVDGEYYSTLEEMHRFENQFNIKISGVAALPANVEELLRERNAECEIRREGAAFVIGTFTGKEVANQIVAEIKAMEKEIEVEIEKQKLK